MSRSSRTIRSPSTTTLKFTGSFSAGCWGPISSSTSGMLHRLRGGGFPILPQGILALRPALVEHEAAEVGVADELDAEQVVDLPLVQGGGGEDVRHRGDPRRLLGDRRADAHE